MFIVNNILIMYTKIIIKKTSYPNQNTLFVEKLKFLYDIND